MPLTFIICKLIATAATKKLLKLMVCFQYLSGPPLSNINCQSISKLDSSVLLFFLRGEGWHKQIWPCPHISPWIGSKQLYAGNEGTLSVN